MHGKEHIKTIVLHFSVSAFLDITRQQKLWFDSF
jgi:hypothetical protein